MTDATKIKITILSYKDIRKNEMSKKCGALWWDYKLFSGKKIAQSFHVKCNIFKMFKEIHANLQIFKQQGL